MKQLIATIREQLAAGTPGPWEAQPMFGNGYVKMQDRKAELYGTNGSTDAQLIVTLRNNASDLLDYIERLEAVVEAASKWEEWLDCTTNPPLIEALEALKEGTK